jgi:hypothetical protein
VSIKQYLAGENSKVMQMSTSFHEFFAPLNFSIQTEYLINAAFTLFEKAGGDHPCRGGRSSSRVLSSI